MSNLNFQVLYSKRSEYVGIVDSDRQFQIENTTPHIFADFLTKEEERKVHSIMLMGVIKSSVRFRVKMNSNTILSVVSCGNHPAYILDKDKLTIMQEEAVSNYQKLTVFFMGVDSHNDKVRCFQLTFDGQGDHFLVTFE